MMNESFKFSTFWGITIILNKVLILFYYILFKIRNIRAGCYIRYQSNGFQKIFGPWGVSLTRFSCNLCVVVKF